MSEPGSVLLDAVLRPAPPLPPRAMAVILGVVAAMNALFALYFVLHGTWPVMPTNRCSTLMAFTPESSQLFT